MESTVTKIHTKEALEAFAADPGKTLYKGDRQDVKRVDCKFEDVVNLTLTLDLSGMDVRAALQFENITFTEEVRLNLSRFRGSVLFRDCVFTKAFSAKGCIFDANLYIKDCDFPKPSLKVPGHFRDDVPRLNLHSARIANLCDLSGTTIWGDVNLNRIIVQNTLRFRHHTAKGRVSIVEGNISASDLTVGKLCDFTRIHVRPRVFDSVQPTQGDLNLDRCSIGSSLLLSGTDTLPSNNEYDHPNIAGNITIIAGVIGQALDFRGGECLGLDLTNASIGHNLRLCETQSSDRNTVFLGEVNLDSAKVGGSVQLDNGHFRQGISASGLTVSGNFSITRSKKVFHDRQKNPRVNALQNKEGFKASLWATYVKVGGSLTLSGMNFESAVNLARCVVGNNWYIERIGGSTCSIGVGQIGVSLNREYSNKEISQLGKPEDGFRDGYGSLHDSVTLYCPEAKITGSLFWSSLKTLGAPAIAEGLSCFQVKFTKRTTFFHVLDLSGSMIYHDLDVRYSRLRRGLLLTSATVSGNFLGQQVKVGILAKHSEADVGDVMVVVEPTRTGSHTKRWNHCVNRCPLPSMSWVNATFLGFIDLRGATLKGPINGDYSDCSASIILDSLSEDHLSKIGLGYHPGGYGYSFSLNGAVIKGGVYARSVAFLGGVDISMAQISGDLNFSTHLKSVHTHIVSSSCENVSGPDRIGLWLRDSSFGGQLQLTGIIIEAGLCLNDCLVDGIADLHDAVIMTSTHKGGTSFSLDARSATIKGPLRASGAIFGGDVLFKDSDIAGIQFRATAGEIQMPRRRGLKPIATVLLGDLIGDHTTVDGSVVLTGLILRGGINLSYSTIEGTFEMQAVPQLEFPTRFEDENSPLDKIIRSQIIDARAEILKATTQSRTSCGRLTATEPETEISIMMQGAKVRGSYYLRGLWCAKGINLRTIHVMGILALDSVSDQKDKSRITTHIGAGVYRSRHFSLRLSNAVVDSHLEGKHLKCESALSLTNARVNADVRLEDIQTGPGLWNVNDNKTASLLLDLLEAGGDILIELKNMDPGGLSARGISVGRDLTIKFVSDDQGKAYLPIGFPQKLEAKEQRPRYQIDLKRSRVPGMLSVDLYPTEYGWLNLTQVRTGEFVGRWIQDQEAGAGSKTGKESKPSFEVDLFEFDEISFHPSPSKDGWHHSYLWLWGSIFVLYLPFFYFLFGEGTFHLAALIAPALLSVYALCCHLYDKYGRHPGRTQIEENRDKWSSAQTFAEQCRFSERFYIRLTEYFSSRGYRDQADLLFRDMKIRELQVNTSLAGLAVMAITYLASFTGVLIVFAIFAYQAGVFVECCYIKRPEAWSSPAIGQSSWTLENVNAVSSQTPLKDVESFTAHETPSNEASISEMHVMLAPLKHMIPFARLDELAEVNPTRPLYLASLPAQTPLKTDGKLSKKKGDDPKGNRRPPEKKEDDPRGAFGRMGQFYFVISVLGYIGFSALVLSVAGLFKKNRHMGSLE